MFYIERDKLSNFYIYSYVARDRGNNIRTIQLIKVGSTLQSKIKDWGLTESHGWVISTWNQQQQ